MASRGKKKYYKQWSAFADYLSLMKRPETFEECRAVVADKVSGLYESEAFAIWNILWEIKPKRIAEVGRNLGGSLFMYGCCCTELEYVFSVDIERFEETDLILGLWFQNHGIDSDVIVADSTEIKLDEDDIYDFVMIDGGHTGPIVKKDIDVWKDNVRVISFHDYADKRTNKHKRVYPDVIAEISAAARYYGWKQIGQRGRSEICFETGVK